jgi:hypothetical protein
MICVTCFSERPRILCYNIIIETIKKGKIMQYIMINDDGDKFYSRNKEMTIRHREDGPAIEYADGYKAWYINGKLHREGGPAVEYTSEAKSWYVKGKLHREDGPAIEHADGYKAWFINDKQYSEKEFNAKMNTCNGKEVVIDGKTYILKLKD